jgi:hypothetical protein
MLYYQFSEESTLELVRGNPRALQAIHPDKRTLELCKIVLESPGMPNVDVPEHLRTQELYRECLPKNGSLLEYITSPTEDDFRVALSNFGCALQWVHPDKRTPELCYLAVKRDPRAIKYVPREDTDFGAWHVAVATLIECGRSLEFIPEELRTREICEAFMSTNPLNFKHVPASYVTQEMANAAFERDQKVFEFIPMDLHTFAMWQKIAQRQRELLAVAPDHILDDPRFLDYIRDDPCTLRFFNRDNIRSAFLDVALASQNLTCLCFCPPERITHDVAIRLVKKNGSVLRFIPPALHSPELYRTAVTATGNALEYVPEDARTLDLCMLAARHNSFQFIPANMFETIEKYRPDKIDLKSALELYPEVNAALDDTSCVCCRENSELLLFAKTCSLPHVMCMKCYAAWYTANPMNCMVCKVPFVPLDIARAIV